MAMLCADIKMILDPKTIVIGGGIGLAEGYLDEVLEHPPRHLDLKIVPATLGSRAGAIGAADIARAAMAHDTPG
uniref:ROK family protein n=1 Tax=Neorhizobium sp. EC2-8 TaxID=3129230 RepID=UPI0031016FB1